MAQFRVGDQVLLPITRKTGVIVEGPNRKNEFQVMVGVMRIWVLASDLKLAQAKKKQGSAPSKKSLRSKLNREEYIRLDLHGFTRLEAVEHIENAINEALLKEINQIRIIHGLGTGAVKSVIHEYLSQSKHVSAFKVEDANPGVTLAYL